MVLKKNVKDFSSVLGEVQTIGEETKQEQRRKKNKREKVLNTDCYPTFKSEKFQGWKVFNGKRILIELNKILSGQKFVV